MKLTALLIIGAAVACAASNPLEDITSRQYQAEIRPLRAELDRLQHAIGLQEFGFSNRLVKADELPDNACGASTYDIKAGMGEIEVLRSDEYAKLPGCLDGASSIQLDQLNTVAHEVMHLVLDLPVEDEARVVAISGVIQPRTHKRK